MALSTQALIDLLDVMIQQSAENGGVVEFSHETERYRGLSLVDLLAERRRLGQQLAAERSGGGFSLFSPYGG